MLKLITDTQSIEFVTDNGSAYRLERYNGWLYLAGAYWNKDGFASTVRIRAIETGPELGVPFRAQVLRNGIGAYLTTVRVIHIGLAPSYAAEARHRTDELALGTGTWEEYRAALSTYTGFANDVAALEQANDVRRLAAWN